ncbi:MAG: sigma-54-dependent Fis family transcriptional regulator, partial [Deltaproteobacteria bacterium]|nr:sigma-54-dependent Fis family transcriptional regulator [Deltaproteobacteria bacterium]
VLILGESGTGKELIAHALHYNSPRRDHHLVTVNCAAIPEELLESELFGHMKGAFTGAVQTRNGRFDAANHGTIFLDEIGDMSLKLQVKLLRVLQERKFEPVGSNKTHDVNVRIIAATNQDLDRMVKEKRFREDLYYRLNVIPIRIPPLRERPDDIPLLVSHFIEKYRQSAKQPVHGMTDQALSCLLTYSWPGNVRELENVIERAAVFCHQDRIEISHLPDKIRCEAGTTVTLQHPLRATAKSQMLPEDGLSLKDAVADFEWNLISQALKRAGGNKHRAALLLKLNRTTLVEKLKKQRGMEGM